MLMVFNQKKKQKKILQKKPELEARISLFSANANLLALIYGCA